MQQDRGGIQESQERDGADAHGNGKDGGARFAREKCGVWSEKCGVGLRKHSDCGSQEGAGGADKGHDTQAWD